MEWSGVKAERGREGLRGWMDRHYITDSMECVEYYVCMLFPMTTLL